MVFAETFHPAVDFPQPGFFLHCFENLDIMKQSKKREGMSLRRFLLCILVAAILLADLFGILFILSKRETKTLSAPAETAVMVTEQTVPVVAELITEPISAPEMTMPVEKKNSVYDSVPRYYQTDYPYIQFGNGTIATSGCSITCLAMVATYLTDQEYTPPQMAYHFGSYGKNNIERLDHGISQMQLPYQRSENIQEVIQALRSGKVVIAMVDEESVFTAAQHFVVFAGINEAGKFVVNDPMETNYLNANSHIRDCYDNGFEYYHLSQGFSGAWIFDKQDMPREPFLFDASIPEQKENRYEGYLLTEEDIYLLACFVCAEALHEPPEVKQAVAEVVFNRVMSENYPNTVREVIYQTEFYRAVNAMNRMDEPGIDQYIAVDTAMYGPYILPEDVCFYSVWEKGQEVWGKLGSYTFAKTR